MAGRDNTNKVNFHFLDVTPTLKRRRLLKRFITNIFAAERRVLQTLDIIFCSDSFLQKINRKYLRHDEYTDVITFDYSVKGAAVQAEIYISVDRVKENSATFKEPVSRELNRVIVHGILHLCGYKDKTRREANEMRVKEEEYLKKFSQFISRETRST